MIKINKKAQITLFLIIGIFALFVIGFIIVIYSSALGQIVPFSRTLPRDITPIQSYVDSCLKAVSEGGLMLVASQGGYIYKSQGGLTQDFISTDAGKFFVPYSGFNVPYLIRKRGYWIGFFSANPPEYPWEFFPCENAACTNRVFKAPIFGEGRLPRLEREEGPNSIQSQLENYVKNNIQGCVDFEVFKESGFEVTKPSTENIGVEFMITKVDVIVKMKYPISIKQVTTGDTFRIQDFQIVHKIQLRKIYSFTQQIINNDVEDVKFNPDGARQEGIIARVTRDIYGHDDLITITDTTSFIGGNPYKFYLARQNRYPALSYIVTPPATENDLVAYDPDEDELTFSILTDRVTVSDGELQDYQIIS